MEERLANLFTPCATQVQAQQRARDLLLSKASEFLEGNRVASEPVNGCLSGAFASSELPEGHLSVEQYFEQLLREALPYSVNLSTPVCMGHMSGVLPQFVPTLAAFIATLNQNLVKRDASRSFSLMERQVISMLHRAIYNLAPEFYEEHAQNDGSTLGIMSAGGTLSNLTALWIARDACFPKKNGAGSVAEEGLAAAIAGHGFKGVAVIGSELMHYSMEKAISLSGLGVCNLCLVPVDRAHRMDLGELRRTVRECGRAGRRIVMIVGVAGTTDSGSVDPLEEIAEIAREANVHFHVDAAWGGPLIFSRAYGHILDGIGRADSVTLDGHKQFYLPLGTSLLLLRDPKAAHVIEKRSRYMLQEGSGDLGARSLEGSRDGASVYLHAALSIIGKRGYEMLMDRNLRLARAMAEYIRGHEQFELLVEPQTNIILYRYVPARLRAMALANQLSVEELTRINQLNERIQSVQRSQSRSFVSRTEIAVAKQGKPVVALRAVLANPRVTLEDIRFVLDDQRRIAAEL